MACIVSSPRATLSVTRRPPKTPKAKTDSGRAHRDNKKSATVELVAAVKGRNELASKKAITIAMILITVSKIYSAASPIRIRSISSSARRYSTGMTFTNLVRNSAQLSSMVLARPEPV